MNISLTQELEEYITQQVQTGHYKSASEVVREALRNQVRRSMEDQLAFRIVAARKQVGEGLTSDADADFFENKRKMIREKYMHNPSTT